MLVSSLNSFFGFNPKGRICGGGAVCPVRSPSGGGGGTGPAPKGKGSPGSGGGGGGGGGGAAGAAVGAGLEGGFRFHLKEANRYQVARHQTTGEKQ